MRLFTFCFCRVVGTNVVCLRKPKIRFKIFTWYFEPLLLMALLCTIQYLQKFAASKILYIIDIIISRRKVLGGGDEIEFPAKNTRTEWLCCLVALSVRINTRGTVWPGAQHSSRSTKYRVIVVCCRIVVFVGDNYWNLAMIHTTLC